MKKIIPYGKHDITEEDINAVVNILKGDFLTQGPTILEFEKAFANYVGSKFAVAVSNATAALHLSTLALNVNQNQKVITTPITFVASANCVEYCGGEICFVDIDPKTYLIDYDSVQNLLSKSPKATYSGLILVDFAGKSVNLEKFRNLANEYNLWIIEDACHAPGAYFYDSQGISQNCGNGNFADLSIFSFHPVKHIACGEGGMITTNSEELYKKLLKLRTHGITKLSDEFTNSIHISEGHTQKSNSNNYPNWYMEMQTLGYNYRLTDFQAALGLSQLKKANNGIEKRREIAKYYNDKFTNKNYILNHSEYIEGHAYHLYIIEVEDRLGLYNYLKDNGILAQVHYFPIHLMPYYKKKNLSYSLPNSEKYYQRCLSLPMYPSLSNQDQDFVIDSITKYYV